MIIIIMISNARGGWLRRVGKQGALSSLRGYRLGGTGMFFLLYSPLFLLELINSCLFYSINLYGRFLAPIEL